MFDTMLASAKPLAAASSSRPVALSANGMHVWLGDAGELALSMDGFQLRMQVDKTLTEGRVVKLKMADQAPAPGWRVEATRQVFQTLPDLGLNPFHLEAGAPASNACVTQHASVIAPARSGSCEAKSHAGLVTAQPTTKRKQSFDCHSAVLAPTAPAAHAPAHAPADRAPADAPVHLARQLAASPHVPEAVKREIYNKCTALRQAGNLMSPDDRIQRAWQLGCTYRETSLEMLQPPPEFPPSDRRVPKTVLYAWLHTSTGHGYFSHRKPTDVAVPQATNFMKSQMLPSSAECRAFLYGAGAETVQEHAS